MSSTVVYGCDWCKEIVAKGRDDKPRYAAKVTVEDRDAPTPPTSEDICSSCRQALEALRHGRFRR